MEILKNNYGYIYEKDENGNLITLGKGAFGIVYKVQKSLALKMTDESKKDYVSYRKEVQILEDLRYPGRSSVIKIYDSFVGNIPLEKESGYAIVTELITGFDVQEFGKIARKEITTNPIIYDTIFLWITKYLLSGLDYIHEKGIIHADITSNNILINVKARYVDQSFLKTKLRSDEYVPLDFKIKSSESDKFIFWIQKKNRVVEYTIRPVFLDFGESVYESHNTGPLPRHYFYLPPEEIGEITETGDIIGRKTRAFDLWAIGGIVLVFYMYDLIDLFPREQAAEINIKTIRVNPHPMDLEDLNETEKTFEEKKKLVKEIREMMIEETQKVFETQKFTTTNQTLNKLLSQILFNVDPNSRSSAREAYNFVQKETGNEQVLYKGKIHTIIE